MATSNSALICFRVLQVLISLAFCVPVGLLLAALSAVIHYLRPVLDDAVHSAGISSSDPTLRSVNAGLGGAMGGVSLVMALCLLSFILSLTWLILTASPKARARAHCCGNHVLCVRYNCDMAWDIVLVLFWAFMLALVSFCLAVYDGAILSVQLQIDNAQQELYKSSSFGARYSSAGFYPNPSYNNKYGSSSYKYGSSASDTDTQISSAANMVLEQGRAILIAAIVLASVQFVSFIITAALSSANRNALRTQAHAEELPMTVPQVVPGMFAGLASYGHMKRQPDVAAKPIMAHY